MIYHDLLIYHDYIWLSWLFLIAMILMIVVVGMIVMIVTTAKIGVIISVLHLCV